MAKMMKCGHVATGSTMDGQYVCVICIGLTDLACVEDGFFNIDVRQERMARCWDCNKLAKSSVNLPFYEYQGYYKHVATELLEERAKILREGWGQGFSGRGIGQYRNPFPKHLQDQLDNVNKRIKEASLDGYYCIDCLSKGD